MSDRDYLLKEALARSFRTAEGALDYASRTASVVAGGIVVIAGLRNTHNYAVPAFGSAG